MHLVFRSYTILPLLYLVLSGNGGILSSSSVWNDDDNGIPVDAGHMRAFQCDTVNLIWSQVGKMTLGEAA